MIPKFRAWHKERKVMANVDAIFFDMKKLIIEGTLMPSLHQHIEAYEWSFDEIELLQWTGLKDSENNLIYEGDILECSVEISRSFEYEGGFEKEYDITGFVAMGRNVWVVNAITGNETINEDWEWNCCGLYDCDNIKIIGNIYENGELLNVT